MPTDERWLDEAADALRFRLGFPKNGEAHAVIRTDLIAAASRAPAAEGRVDAVRSALRIAKRRVLQARAGNIEEFRHLLAELLDIQIQNTCAPEALVPAAPERAQPTVQREKIAATLRHCVHLLVKAQQAGESMPFGTTTLMDAALCAAAVLSAAAPSAELTKEQWGAYLEVIEQQTAPPADATAARDAGICQNCGQPWPDPTAERILVSAARLGKTGGDRFERLYTHAHASAEPADVTLRRETEAWRAQWRATGPALWTANKRREAGNEADELLSRWLAAPADPKETR